MQLMRRSIQTNLIIAVVSLLILGVILGGLLYQVPSSLFFQAIGAGAAILLLLIWLNTRDPALPPNLVQTALRLDAGEAESVLAEAVVRRENGDRSAENAIILSATYSYLGRGTEAQPFAHEALTTLERSGMMRKRAWAARVQVDMALVTLFDALLAQGHFIEAASYLGPRVPYSHQPNMMALLVTWALFLAEEDGRARAMLKQMGDLDALDAISPAVEYGSQTEPEVKHTANGQNNKRGVIESITPKYAFMLAFVECRLVGKPPSEPLYRHRDQFASWEDEAQRHADNPYGNRLRDILNQIAELLPDRTPVGD